MSTATTTKRACPIYTQPLRKHTAFDSFGRITEEAFFDSSGNSISQAHAQAIDQLFGYTGRPLDEATGLQYNLHRWYDADTGRWLNQDPKHIAAGHANFYSYVGNKVTTYVDPDGLEEQSFFDWINPFSWYYGDPREHAARDEEIRRREEQDLLSQPSVDAMLDRLPDVNRRRLFGRNQQLVGRHQHALFRTSDLRHRRRLL